MKYKKHTRIQNRFNRGGGGEKKSSILILLKVLSVYIHKNIEHTQHISFRSSFGVKGYKLRPNSYGLYTGRDLYSATPAVTQDLGFCSLKKKPFMENKEYCTRMSYELLIYKKQVLHVEQTIF